MTLFDPEVGSPAAPSGPLVRVRATVAYDGTDFAGFAAQPRVRTVGGTLATTLQRVLGHPVDLTCAGRTDAGVHAWGQVVSFDASAEGFDPERVRRAVNKLCAPAIALRSIEAVGPGFDARFDAKARVYRYSIRNSEVPDPFTAGTSWQVGRPLDLGVLRLACDPLIGEHDFSSFCRRPKGEPEASLVRRVLDARWEVDDRDAAVLRFWIEATAFCHQMVRSIVGTLVDVGSGRRTAADVTAILRARARSRTGNIAPPHGLCLFEVRY